MNAVQGLASGTVIGRDFKIVKLLASGNMGSVYIAEQLSTGKQRALKVMSVELAKNDRARERFVLEAKVGAKIESDHVVETVTAGIDEAGGMPYLVMELLKGEELSDLVRREGALPLATVAEMLKQAGHSLAMAHSQGIVHRDIKPQNLFIAESRREGVPFTVKILDFGIAKLVAEQTQEGTQPVGTPLFMAPEQTDRRGNIGPPADVWPLGLLAFYMLTGSHYWRSVSVGVTALLREVVIEPLEPPSVRLQSLGLNLSLPAGFDDWFGACVNRDLSQRYADAGAAVKAFQQLVASPAGIQVAAQTAQLAAAATLDADSLELGPEEATTHEGKKSSKGVAIAAVAGVLVVGGIVAATAGGGSEPAAPPKAAAAKPSGDAGAAAKLAKKDKSSCPKGMILIKGGNMFMGSKDKDLRDDVRPPHKVKLSNFCIDKYEVTVEMYEACSKSGNCLRAPTTVEFPRIKKRQRKYYSTLCTAGKTKLAKHPINCVDWNMANHFCSGEGGRLEKGGARLPTEAEWEFAARGPVQHVYPWGDEKPGPTHLNACGKECDSWYETVKLAAPGMMFKGDDGYAATAPVGSYTKGATMAGVFDMAGNVWEWVADWYGPYEAAAQNDPKGPAKGKARVIRGGGFNGVDPTWAKPSYRYRMPPGAHTHGIGFRCAFTLKGG